MSTLAQPLTSVALRGRLAGLRGPVLTALAYWAGAEVAFAVGTLSDEIFAPFWPPNAVLFCALAVVPVRHWWIYVLAVLPAHVLAELSVGMSWPQIAVAFITNCALAVIAAAACRRLLGDLPWLDTPQRAGLYALVAAGLVPCVVALGGAFMPVLGGASIDQYWTFWTQWVLSNTVSALTLAPAGLMVLAERHKTRVSAVVQVEALLLTLGLVLVCAIAFTGTVRSVGAGFPALLYLPLPLLLWAAFRFGASGASAAMLVVTVTLLWRALNGPSPFIAATPETSAAAVQLFLTALAVPLLLLGAAIDETRRAQRASRESEHHMTLAASAADVGLWRYHAEGDRFWITRHGRHMLGFGQAQPLSWDRMLNAVHPDDREAARAALHPTAVSDRLTDTEFRIMQPAGGISWMRARVRAEPDDPAQISGTLTDITELKRAESEIAEQRRELAHLMRVSMLGELSGGIAHELTQPLTAILSNAQAARMLMRSAEPDLAEIAAAIDDIIQEDNRAGEVIHRMRGFLKRGPTRREPVDINDLARSTLRLLNSELIARRITLRTEFADDLPQTSGDSVQLQQVLLNLVMNSMEAMNEIAPAQRVVCLSTESNNSGQIRIRVSDSGPGLTDSQEKKAFQPFFTTKEGGLGLGLAICSSIISAHGGTLKLENNRTGGATATLVLSSDHTDVAWRKEA